jgi:four helix bundle protein
MNKNKDNLIVQLTLQFARKIVVFSNELDRLKKYTISKQLIRCGTSIGANVWEAQNAESKKDFIHKIKIALKEAEYWLLVCKDLEGFPDVNLYHEDLESILKVLNKIISSSKQEELVIH